MNQPEIVLSRITPAALASIVLPSSWLLLALTVASTPALALPIGTPVTAVPIQLPCTTLPVALVQTRTPLAPLAAMTLAAAALGPPTRLLAALLNSTPWTR